MMAEPPICACGIPVRVKPSWIVENPGKKNYECAYYEVDNGGGDCGYFKWYDTSRYERCDKLVRHTRRLTMRVRELEVEIVERRHKERIMKFLLFLDSIIVLYQWL